MTAIDVRDPKQLRKAVKALAKQCSIIETAHARVGVRCALARRGADVDGRHSRQQLRAVAL